jgi:prepilin-type N-terminal cleavage/methylation domain-containing protein
VYKAFTLIELLIVVAIIAILAAIAVPNFLEAQTRAKVSRMKTDMRTLATGMESYHVDNNKYPIGFPGDPLPALVVTSLGGRWGLGQLSSPISYLTNPLLRDVFGPATNFTPVTDYDYAPQYSLRGINGSGGIDVGVSTVNPGDPAQLGYWWLLRSFGPDRDADGYSTQIANNQVTAVIEKVYDPTNGTVTDGNIYRVGGPPMQEAGKVLLSAASK